MWPKTYQGGYTPKLTQESRTVKIQGRDCWGCMSLSLVVSRSAVYSSSPGPPFFLLPFPSSPFSQFCHIYMNLGLQGFTAPQAVAYYICHHGDWCLCVPATSLYFLSSSLQFLTLLYQSTELLSSMLITNIRNQSGKSGCECLMKLPVCHFDIHGMAYSAMEHTSLLQIYFLYSV